MPEYRISVVVTGEGGAEFRDMERGAAGAERRIASMDRTLGKVFDKLESIGRKMMLVGTGVVGGVGALAYAGLKYNATVEQLKTKLQVFLGTQERVKEAFEWASDITLRVPLTRRDVIPVVTMLEQYGLAYQSWTESVINAAAATKAPGESINDQMQTIATALGRIKTGSVGEGIRMLEEAGVAIEHAGLKFKATKTGREWLETPASALKKIKKMLDTDFKDAGEKFGKTWEGLMMKVKSLAERALGAGTEPLFKKFSANLERLTTWMASSAGQEQLKQWGIIFGDTLMEGVKMAVELGRTVLPVLKDIVHWFAKLSPHTRVWLLLLPLVGGFGMTAAGKIGNLALALGRVGIGGTMAAKGIGAVGAAGGSAATTLLPFLLAIAAMVAQLKLLDELGGKISALLGLGKIGPIGAAWAFTKDWNPLAGKWGVGGVGRKIEKAQGKEERPKGKAFGPEWYAKHQKPATGKAWGPRAPTWGPLAAEDTAEGGLYTTPFAGAGEGGGGEAGGGGGRSGGITIYQTVERLIIEGVKAIDEASLRNALGKIAVSEVPTGG